MLSPSALHDILLKSSFISQSDIDSADKHARELGKPIEDILIYRGLITEDLLGQLIAEYYQVPYLNISHKTIPAEIINLIPEQAAHIFRLIAIDKKGSEIHLAMEDPSDLEAKEFVKRKTGLKLKIFFTLSQSLNTALGQYRKNLQQAFSQIIESNLLANSSSPKSGDLSQLASNLPIINILDTILEYAVAERASDIHLEATEVSSLIRFRIDGILHDMLDFSKDIHPALVARVKIISQLKIDEHRIPQDGRFKFKVKDNNIALRVSILPGNYGENIVLRILPESERPLALEELGLTGHNLDLVKANIKKPHGMILVTGPTGSGKTTTLYSVLTLLNSTEVKICTVEDPIEYGIGRINQIQINPAAGLTFAAGLRALLRHDPDIIMVGEIRDKETAEMAIHSALTGHLVLSTLHTNDAASTIPRFLDMGAEGFLVASTVNLIIAQRLARKICQNCIEAYKLDPETILFLSKHTSTQELSGNFYRGKGCAECSQTGYKGRVGIFEVLEANPEIRELTIKHASTDALNDAAIKHGMIPLIRDCVNKASGGITTIEEILRVVRE